MKISVLSFSLYIVLFSSCTKNTIQLTPAQPIEIGSVLNKFYNNRTSQHDGFVSFTDAKMAYTYEKFYDNIFIDAGFFENKDENKPRYAGKLAISGINIPYVNKGYVLQVPSLDDTVLINKVSNLWGSKVKLNVKPDFQSNQYILGSFPKLINNVDSALSVDFYLPQRIQLYASCVDNLKLDPNQNVSLHWSADYNNPNKKVLVCLIKDVMNADFTMQIGNSEIVFLKEVDDVGNFILTPSDMASLSRNNYVTIMIARANSLITTDQVTSKQIIIDAYSYSSTGQMLVK